MTKQISVSELNNGAQSDQGKPWGEVPHLSASHGVQKQTAFQKGGPTTSLYPKNKEKGTNYQATGITERPN